MKDIPRLTTQRCRAVSVLAFIGFAGCASDPPRPPETPVVMAPDSNVYFHAAPGRPAVAPEQQDRDRYECNAWAVRQTGFDPSLPDVPPHQRVHVVVGGAPDGSGVVAGAVTGAVVGAAVSDPWHAGRGALIGALAGAAIGDIADEERSAATDRVAQAAAADVGRRQAAAVEQRAVDYRRAMAACLEGRGYIVR